MVRLVLRVFLFCNLSFLINLNISSQAEYPEMIQASLPSFSGEKIRLFTDRGIYCVNERIYFTAEYSCINGPDTLAWSNVLYVELIKWNGEKLARIKLEMNRTGADGSIEIPGNTLSGNYYLRAYTKWMRNFPTHEYARLLVKIVNPYLPETDEGPVEKPDSPVLTMRNIARNKMLNGIICKPDKNEYRPGEKVEVTLDIDKGKLSYAGEYCISVARDGDIDTTVQSFEPVPVSPESSRYNMEYLPEIRGMTISGKILDKPVKSVMKNVQVSLSETRYGEYFSVCRTNDGGRFVFLLPDMTGNYDFFIQTDASSEILIDNDFCNRPVNLPYVAFSLNPDEVQRIKDMVINRQLTERFMPDKNTKTDSPAGKPEPVVFYGNKKTVYYTSKYIELPNIEEFANEIIIEAEIINKKGMSSVMIKSRTSLSAYPPLILLDNVQVDNDDRLLKIPLNRIEKVEIINKGYIVDEMKYSGVMSIYSKNRDFAGLDLNKNSMFFTYGLFSAKEPGDDFNGRPGDPRIPDRRNLLYWNPAIQLSAGKKSGIMFFTSDCKGDYIVYVRAKNSRDNQEIYGKCHFSVR